MKKILPIIVAVSLALAACGSKNDSKPVDNTEVSAESTEKEEKETKAEEESAVSTDGFEATYTGGSLPIVEIDGERYFDFSADDFLKQINANAKEVMKDPAVYKVTEKQEKEGYVLFESDKGLICMVSEDEDSGKLAGVYVMGVQSDEFGLSNLAIEATPVLMTLDPNLDFKYCSMHLADIAMAAQITFGQSQYAYEGVHEGIQEMLYGEDDFIILSFAPADENAGEVEEAGALATRGTKPDFGKLSDDLYSFQLQIDGDVYQLPMTYDQFTAFGWTYDGDDKETLSSGSYSSTNVFKWGKMQCYVSLVNFDVNSIPLNQCYIASIKIDSSMVKDTDAVVTLPGGVTLGSNYDEAITLYGTPGYEYDNGSTRRSATYSLSTYQEVEIGTEYEQIDIVGEIEVKNMKKPDDFIAGEVSGEVPAIVTKYQTPAKLSDKFEDYTVELGGDLYQLPAPVSAFVANGWKIVEDSSEEFIAGKDSSWVTLMKDNQKHKSLVKNYDENAISIENGFVTEVVSDIYDKKTPIRTTGGFTVGMSRDEVEKVLTGVDYETDESSTFDYYYIYTGDTRMDYYCIMVDTEKNEVVKVEVKYQPRVADYVNR